MLGLWLQKNTATKAPGLPAVLILVLALLIGGNGACAAQPANGVQGVVVTNRSSIAGVAFIGPNDLSFNDAVTKVLSSSRTPTTNEWLPFSAVLTNNTGDSIVAVVVRWVKILPDGRKNTLVVNQTFFSSRTRPVQSGQPAVVLPVGGVLIQPSPSGSQDATNRPDQITKLQAFQAATRVEVTLDGVLFASGQFVGPNETHGFEELLARLSARNMYSEALARKANGQSAAEVVSWLAAIAGQGHHLDIDPQTGVPTDSNVSGMADAARVLIQAYKQQGAALMYQFAQAYSSESIPLNIFR